ncbi:MAG: hypothetical protein WBV94_20500 [Blastocatellia bacterium]
MAREKSSQPPGRFFPKLTAPREEAQSRIEAQIKKGNDIKSRPISTDVDLMAAKKEYYNWNTFNSNLLRRLFDSEELSVNYSAWYGIDTGDRKSLQEEIKDLLADTDSNIHKLRTIIERLPIYDEPESIRH